MSNLRAKSGISTFLTRDEEISHSASCVNSVDASELNMILPLQKAELVTHFVVNDKNGRFFLAYDSRFPILILLS